MKLAFPIAIAVALTTAAPARADSSASARLYNLAYELIDLDPADGIAPGISFSTAPHQSTTGVVIQQFEGASMVVSIWDTDHGNGPFDPLSHERAGSGWSGSSSVTGNGMLKGTELRSEGHAVTREGLQTSFAASALVSRHPESWYVASAITLTPHTRVVFSANYDIAARVAFDTLTNAYDWDDAEASAWIEVFDQGDEMQYQHGAQFDQSMAKVLDWIGQRGDFWSGGAGYARQGSLSAYLDNPGHTSMAAAVSMGTSARGEVTQAAAVPEPSVTVSVLAGLGMVAGLARARRRKGA